MKSTAAALLGGVALGIGLIGSPGAAIANDGVIQAAADPNAWAVNGRGYDNTRFSPLTQITTGNVGKLRLAYSFQLGSLRSNESTPLVIGDTLYVSTSWGPKYVYALDAATGAQKWKYEPEIPDDVLEFACCDVNNRGVTYADGKIFFGRLDGTNPINKLIQSQSVSRNYKCFLSYRIHVPPISSHAAHAAISQRRKILGVFIFQPRPRAKYIIYQPNAIWLFPNSRQAHSDSATKTIIPFCSVKSIRIKPD